MFRTSYTNDAMESTILLCECSIIRMFGTSECITVTVERTIFLCACGRKIVLLYAWSIIWMFGTSVYTIAGKGAYCFMNGVSCEFLALQCILLLLEKQYIALCLEYHVDVWHFSVYCCCWERSISLYA